MRVSMSLFLAATTCAALVPAQGLVPPLVVASHNPSTAFEPSRMVPPFLVTSIQQIHMTPRDAGLFDVTLTVTGLDPRFGGAGGKDLLCGVYDAAIDLFVANGRARALNTPADEFGLMAETEGLAAVFDRLGGPPQIAARSNRNMDWTHVGVVSGLPPQRYYDPAIAAIDGQGYLLHVDLQSGEIVLRQLFPAPTGLIAGPAATLIEPTRRGAIVNSPTPIVDTDGELIAISHHEHLGSDNDHYVSFDLDPDTPALLMNDTSTWSNNGGFAGGRFFDAEDSPTPYHVLELDSFWFTGGRAAIGERMEISAYCTPGPTSGLMHISYMLLSMWFSQPMPVAGCHGLLGLHPGGMIGAERIGVHDPLTGRATMNLPIPNDPALRGIVIPAQSVTVDARQRIYFGNTAVLTIED